MIRFCLDITGTEFRLLDFHYEEFWNVNDERFSKRYGFWRPVTDEVVGKSFKVASWCPRPPPVPLELVCEPCADYVPWQDDVPETEVG